MKKLVFLLILVAQSIIAQDVCETKEENFEDLKEFNAKEFADALIPASADLI